MAPAAVHHTLLDEGVYVASVSSMHWILRTHGEVRERRRHAVHPPKAKSELIADGPTRVWSWDITKLRGPAKRNSYHLYAVIDIYSRYTVAWLLAEREDAALAERLPSDAITKQGVAREQLTIHADSGTSMASRTVAQTMADLGLTKSHSRPRCSNDNPFSEAQFKTLKYRPDFPDRFGSIQDARAHCRAFFTWYNTIHRYSGIGWHTPPDVHHGHAERVRDARTDVLTTDYARKPERFVRGIPQPPAYPNPRGSTSPTTSRLCQRTPEPSAPKRLTPSVGRSVAGASAAAMLG